MRDSRFLVFKVLILVISFIAVLCSFAEDCRAEPSVTGVWDLNANSFKGTMKIYGNPGAYSGQLKFDDLGKWEKMLDLRINDTSISFRRAHADQRYKGKINAGSMRGVFNQEGSGRYNWKADKN